MNIVDLKFVPQGTPGLNIQAFDCGRKSVNDFFHNEAQDYQDELFGKTYYWVLPDHPTEVVAGFTVANASIFTSRRMLVEGLGGSFFMLSGSAFHRYERYGLNYYANVSRLFHWPGTIILLRIPVNAPQGFFYIDYLE